MKFGVLASILLISGAWTYVLAAETTPHAPASGQTASTAPSAANPSEPAAAPPPAPRARSGGRHVGEGRTARVCFNSVETREKIAARGLSDPFRLLRGASGRIQGEPLRVKLCRLDDEYVYDIAVLHRDGRLVHVFLNAVNGQTVGANDR